MQYHSLGKSNLKVSRIGYGCMSLNGSAADNQRLLRQAFDQGINYFDTADLYQKGENEKWVGAALKDVRKEVIIATKVGNQWRKDGSGWDWNPTKPYLLQSVEESLRRLQTDYIDLYQLHGGTIHDPIEETIEAFEQLKKAGKIREYGISSIRPNVIREYVRRSSIVSNMMQYSLLDRRPEETALPLLAEQQVSVVTRGSLAKGLLIDKPAKPYLDWSAEEVEKAASTVAGMANAERDAVAVSLGFVLKHPTVAAAVVGIRTAHQLQEALQATHAPILTDKEWELLSTTIPPNFYQQHR